MRIKILYGYSLVRRSSTPTAFDIFVVTVEVRLSGTRLTGKFDYPDLIEKKKTKKTLRS